jgi:hypothetical protein
VYDSPLIAPMDPAAVFSHLGAYAYQAPYFSPVDSVKYNFFQRTHFILPSAYSN